MSNNKFFKSFFLIQIFVFIFQLPNNSDILAQYKDWKQVDSVTKIIPNQVFSHYYGLKCADSLNCMVWAQLTGSGGFYFRRTTDGGVSWKNVYMDSAYFYDYDNKHYVPKLFDLAYPNVKLFIAVGDSGLVIRTTDKGETWDRYYFDTNISHNRIRMFDENFGRMFTCYNDCMDLTDLQDYVTYDGGKTWELIKRDTMISFSAIDLINKEIFCGLWAFKNSKNELERKVVWVHNNWETWDTVSCPPMLFLDFIDTSYGWGASSIKLGDTSAIQLIYHTIDGGKTWEKQRDTVYNAWGIRDIKFYDRNFGIASSGFSHVMITTNGGKKWNDYEIEEWHYLHADLVNNIQIPSATTAYVILDYNYVYKYTREITNVDENENARMKEMKISPNPVGEYIEIAGDLNPTINRRVEGIAVNEIRIYNILGECILSTPALRATSQEGNFRIDISNLPSGIYYVRLGDWVGRFVKIE
ncbi:MAG: T9SS type A sorting domain-containing protein [Candidatus Kapabacteria bacterium]|nr:T9SS type A sorting domain-containing protein [Candidatus Kapabacteria bacterium]